MYRHILKVLFLIKDIVSEKWDLLIIVFKEKRIPNYNSEPYYNNSIILRDEIRLLANIHEDSLFTSNIAGKNVIFILFVFSDYILIFYI